MLVWYRLVEGKVLEAHPLRIRRNKSVTRDGEHQCSSSSHQIKSLSCA